MVSGVVAADIRQRFMRHIRDDHRLVVVGHVFDVESDPAFSEVGKLHGDGDEIRLSGLDVYSRKNWLRGLRFRRAIAAQEQHQRAGFVARFLAGDADRPAVMPFAAIPLGGDRAHLRIVVGRAKMDKGLQREIVVWELIGGLRGKTLLR